MALSSRIFILSLAREQQRRMHALAQIRPTGLEFELVDALDSRMLRPELMEVPASAWSLSNGEVACYLSHLRLLQRLSDYDLDYGIILEDDFVLQESPGLSLSTVFDRLPAGADHVQLNDTKDKVFDQYRRLESGQVFNRVSPTNVGSYGYVVSRKLADYILSHHSMPQMPIDHLFIELSRRTDEFGFYDLNERLIGFLADVASCIDREEHAQRASKTFREWWDERWIRR
jgi:glycosyl transferase family 25